MLRVVQMRAREGDRQACVAQAADHALAAALAMIRGPAGASALGQAHVSEIDLVAPRVRRGEPRRREQKREQDGLVDEIDRQAAPPRPGQRPRSGGARAPCREPRFRQWPPPEARESEAEKDQTRPWRERPPIERARRSRIQAEPDDGGLIEGRTGEENRREKSEACGGERRPEPRL